jgi:hypothetical protein
MWYVIFLTFFTLSSLTFSCDHGSYSGYIGRLHVALDLAIAAFAVHFFILEFRQLYRDGAYNYFSSIWNYFDIVGFSLVIVNIPYRLYCWENEPVLQSIAALALWFKLLSYARAYRSIGPFVRMLVKILTNISAFVLVLAAVIVAYSHALFLLFRRQTTSTYSSWDVLFLMYQAMLGDFDTTDFDANPWPGLVRLLFVGFTFTVTVIMLNLLIALMTDIYGRVQRNVENEWLVERCKIILEVEALLPRYLTQSDSLFPRWLHVLQPVKFDDAPEPTLSDVIESVKRLESSLEERTETANAELRKKLTAMQSAMMSMSQLSAGMKQE